MAASIITSSIRARRIIRIIMMHGIKWFLQRNLTITHTTIQRNIRTFDQDRKRNPGNKYSYQKITN